MLKRLFVLWVVCAALFGFAAGGSFVAGYLMPDPQQHQNANADQNNTKHKTKEETEQAIATYTGWLTIFTAVMAIATIVLGGATIGLYLTGEKQVEAAIKAANAAEISARASVAIHLPIIRMSLRDDLRINIREEDDYAVITCSIPGVEIWNIGKSDTFPTRLVAGFRRGKRLSEKPRYHITERFHPNRIIRPNDITPEYETIGACEITIIQRGHGDKRKDIWAGESRLWFYCCLAYKDFMNSDHTAAFCWRWSKGSDGMKWLADEKPEYNQKT
jgi:hypothetical protein